MSTGIGDALRQAREQQGRTIEDAARATRVRSDYIRALEEESFTAFGGDVYAKGFLRSYARYLSLDPEPLLEVYRREVAQDDWQATALVTTPAAAPPPRGAPPMWIAWVLVGILVLAGLFVVGSVFGGRTPAPVAQPPVGPVEDTEPSDPATTPSEPETSPSPSPTPRFEGVQLLVVFEEDCWINVEVDGQQIEQGTIPSGETRSYDGEDRVTIRFGNSGGVRVELNGEDLGPPGERGQPETVTFTEDGAEQAT